MLILNVNVGTRQCRFLIQIRGQKTWFFSIIFAFLPTFTAEIRFLVRG